MLTPDLATMLLCLTGMACLPVPPDLWKLVERPRTPLDRRYTRDLERRLTSGRKPRP